MNIKYPKSLNKIFQKLIKHKIKPVIVGGYVRDAILKIDSIDIDIELYNIKHHQDIELILREFGSVKSVGKSFGIYKLKYKNLDLDFSFPRIDNKIDSGHKGFKIKFNSSLNFKEASNRRDFTINAIGYDLKNKKIIDPYNGIKDIKKNTLKAVDLRKFDEDPLRVLRAIMFASRFNFKLDNKLFIKCKSMMQNNVLNELARERIFQEIKKILLKSQKPSKGFLLLQKIDGFLFFSEFNLLQKNEFLEILKSIDTFKSYNLKDENSNIIIFLALLSSKFSNKNIDSFLNKLTNSKKLILKVKLFTQIKINFNQINNYEIYKLATKIDIELYLLYLNSLYHNKKDKEISILGKKAKELNVLNNKLEPIICGKMLIKQNLKSSKKFSKILNDAYEAQMKEKFKNEQEAIKWLEKYLSNFYI